MLSNVGAEMTFQLPLTASGAFPALFASLEADAAALGVASYGVSVTTLEEVFIKVAEEGGGHGGGDGAGGGGALTSAEAEARSANVKSLAGGGAAVPVAPGADFVRGAARGGVFWRHFFALLRKRALAALRDRRALLCQLAIPVLAVLGGLLLLRGVSAAALPPRRLDFSDLNAGLPPRAGAAAGPPNFVPWVGPDALRAWVDASGRPAGAGGAGASVNGNASFFAVNATALAAAHPLAAFPYGGNCTAWGLGDVGLPPFILGAADASAEGRANPADNATYLADLNDAYALSAWLLSGAGAGAEGGASRYAAVSVGALAGGPGGGGGAFASYAGLVNTSAWHMAPTVVAAVDSGLLSWLAGDARASIAATVAPLPFSQAQVGIISSFSAFVAVLFIVIAFSFIPASFVVFIVKEREVAAKHQQLISGVSIPAYWLSAYAWDVVNFAVPGGACFALLVGFNVLVDDGRGAATAALLVAYGLAVAPFTYVLSFAFASHSAAQTSMLVLNLLCLILLLASFVMKAIPSTCAADASLRFVYRLLPGYALGNGLQQLSIFKQLIFTESRCGTLAPAAQFAQTFTPFSLAAAGWPLLYLLAEAVGYTALAIAIDVGLSFPALRARVLPDRDLGTAAGAPDDDDVAAEARRVRAGGAEGDTVVIDALRKVYGGTKAAVRDLSFGVPAGEVFGFLGINGAGKTTTLKILSGDIIPTRGTARLEGLDILRDQMAVRQLLGYCASAGRGAPPAGEHAGDARDAPRGCRALLTPPPPRFLFPRAQARNSTRCSSCFPCASTSSSTRASRACPSATWAPSCRPSSPSSTC